MKLALILLAAGDSRRFEGNKLLYPWAGKPMYRHIAEELEKLPENTFERRLVVTQYPEIAKDLGRHGYEVIENLESRLGISHSIELALQELTKQDMAYCFTVCDQPFLRVETVLSFVNGWRESRKGAGCLCSRGELGNPAIFSPRYREELLALQGDVGGKRVIRRHMEDVYLFEAAEAELKDIDTRTCGPALTAGP